MMFELRNELLTDLPQVINVLNNQIDRLKIQVYFLIEELTEKSTMVKLLMKSDRAMKQGPEHCEFPRVHYNNHRTEFYPHVKIPSPK